MAGLIISPRARIFQGHDWVYGTEVRKIFGNPQPGDVVALKDFKDRFLGSAMFNPHSQIVARRFSRRKQEQNCAAAGFRKKLSPGSFGANPTGFTASLWTVTRIIWSSRR